MTIEDGLMRELRETAHKSGLSLKELVNRALRAALDRLHKPTRSRAYRGPTFSMGHPAGGLDKALQWASELENEEILRKLALRK